MLANPTRHLAAIVIGATLLALAMSAPAVAAQTLTLQQTFQGGSPAGYGPSPSTRPVTTFVPSPDASLSVGIPPGSPDPPTLNESFAYRIAPTNTGDVPLDTFVVIDTVPVEMQVMQVTTGAYTNLSNFAAGEGVRVSYEKNTALGVFTLWGSSPNTSTNVVLSAPPPGLGAGQYITRVRWQYGQAAPGMQATSIGPSLAGQLINPDNAGGSVAFGDTIQNCANLTAVYTAGPTGIARNACKTFNVRGPDGDGDGIPDATDNCPTTPNPSQANRDGDSQGDLCDADDDNDTVPDGSDACPTGVTGIGNDPDGDGCKNSEDADDDNDAIADGTDNCVTVPNPGQENKDGDGQGDACDEDDDGDGVLDTADSCALFNGSGANGCPNIDRTLGLVYKAAAAKFRGTLGPPGPCAATQKVNVLMVKPGPDKKIAATTTKPSGKFTLSENVEAGKYYASAGAQTIIGVGNCPAVTSKKITID